MAKVDEDKALKGNPVVPQEKAQDGSGWPLKDVEASGNSPVSTRVTRHTSQVPGMLELDPPTETTRNWFPWAIGLAMLGASAVGLSATMRPNGTVCHPWRRLHPPDPYQTTAEQVDHWWSEVHYHTPGEVEGLPNLLLVKPHKVASSSMANLIRVIAARNGGIRREYMFPLDISYFFAQKELQPLEEGVHTWADHRSLIQLLEISEPKVIEESFKITLLRNPLDRCFSSFYYYGRKGRQAEWQEISKEELFEWKMHFKFCGKTAKWSSEMSEVGPKALDSSVEETLDFYNLIGITERYMESLTVLKMVLGLRYGDMLSFNDKFHPSRRPPISEEPPEVIKHIKTLIPQVDWDLYNAADQQLSEIIERLEPDFSVIHNKLVESVTNARLECDLSFGYHLPDGFGCFSQGNCQLSCLNKYATDHDLWDNPTPVDLVP